MQEKEGEAKKSVKDDGINVALQDIGKLLEKNIEISKSILDLDKKIKKRINIMSAADLLRLLIIFIPLILGIIYLPPIIKNVFKEYKDIIGVNKQDFFTHSLNDFFK